MPKQSVSVWTKMPFVKLFIPLITGIIIQWYLQVPLNFWKTILSIGFVLVITFFLLPVFKRFRLAVLNGIITSLIFLSIGATLTAKSDIRNDPKWFGNTTKNCSGYIVTLDEKPIEKNKSFKVNAIVNYAIDSGQKAFVATGKMILYFDKNSFPGHLEEGSEILFKKTLSEIKNSGNPGGFDYTRYCLFQQITHQAYLKTGDYELTGRKNASLVTKLIGFIRTKVLNILGTFIPGDKEKGLAEALLIGYKDDLDKTLVQSYTNTGVVHIIAISGLHLGLIYWLLVQLLKPLDRKKYTRWLKPVLVISGLWLFSLLAGAQPSVLRSAVMFTCIVLGESMGRKSSIYNSLACSAFILLCYNPYWLWDVGFQLSYAAVLSIVIFMQPVYNWFYVKNKALDFIWKMNAVTIAAQILTIPISIYHFHQFPNYFLLTNFIAVPLSSIIVLGEILLCVVSILPLIASFVGKLLHYLIWFMNSWIERIEALPFSLWDGLQISFLQMILLTLSICTLSYWLLEKKREGFIVALSTLLGFFILRSISLIESGGQKKIIVYNVPKKEAVDIVEGNQYQFIGDSSLKHDNFSRNFYLKPARIMDRTYENELINDSENFKEYFSYSGKHVLMIDTSFPIRKTDSKPVVDLLILSKNPKLYMSSIADCFDIKQVVIDGSVPRRKSNYWKKDCDSLNIPIHDVSTDGAFVMNLQ
ncbi:MAG: ComEC/Rec2 family competence protein [Chitinophagaceae bacterium]